MEITMQVILSVATTVMTGVIGWLFHKFKKYEEKRELWEKKRLEEISSREQAVNKALRALCRDRILNSYRYNSKRNFISTQDLETITKLFNAYKALGGNGTLTAVYEMILKLPIKDGDTI